VMLVQCAARAGNNHAKACTAGAAVRDALLAFPCCRDMAVAQLHQLHALDEAVAGQQALCAITGIICKHHGWRLRVDMHPALVFERDHLVQRCQQAGVRIDALHHDVAPVQRPPAQWHEAFTRCLFLGTSCNLTGVTSSMTAVV